MILDTLRSAASLPPYAAAALQMQVMKAQVVDVHASPVRRALRLNAGTCECDSRAGQPASTARHLGSCPLLPRAEPGAARAAGEHGRQRRARFLGGWRQEQAHRPAVHHEAPRVDVAEQLRMQKGAVSRGLRLQVPTADGLLGPMTRLG